MCAWGGAAHTLNLAVYTVPPPSPRVNGLGSSIPRARTSSGVPIAAESGRFASCPRMWARDSHTSTQTSHSWHPRLHLACKERVRVMRAGPHACRAHGRSPGLLSRPVLLCGIQRNLLPALADAGSAEVYACRCGAVAPLVPAAVRLPSLTRSLLRLWVLPAGTRILEHSVPEGYTLRRLEEGDAPLVNDRWPYRSDDTLPRIKQTIAGLPSSVLPLRNLQAACRGRRAGRACRGWIWG